MSVQIDSFQFAKGHMKDITEEEFLKNVYLATSYAYHIYPFYERVETTPMEYGSARYLIKWGIWPKTMPNY